MIRMSLATSSGRRSTNEDCAAIINSGRYQALVIADGMGGHQAGEVASQMVVEGIRALLDKQPLNPIQELKGGIPKLSRAIFEESARDASREGMGSTVVLALTDGNQFWIFNVGDSRAYIVSSSNVMQLSVDHTVIADSISKGFMSEAEAEQNPYRHALLQCMGHEEKPVPEIKGPLSIPPGSVLLLCSDGLSGFVTEIEMIDALEGTRNIQAAAEHLMRCAYWKKSDDNITLGIIEIGQYRRRPNGIPLLPPIPEKSGVLKKKRPVFPIVVVAGLSIAIMVLLSVLVFLKYEKRGKRFTSNAPVVSSTSSPKPTPPRNNDNDYLSPDPEYTISVPYQDGLEAKRSSLSLKCQVLIANNGKVEKVKFLPDYTSGGIDVRATREAEATAKASLLDYKLRTELNGRNGSAWREAIVNFTPENLKVTFLPATQK